jgi:hypothetical protein
MHRRLRVDVVEGERMIVLEHGLGRDFSAQDPGKDVLLVIGAPFARSCSSRPFPAKP